MGIEPTNVGTTIRCVNHFATTAMAGTVGIEPTSKVLETSILPLNYVPIFLMVEGGRFELPNPKERIYSPPRLANFATPTVSMPARGLEPPTYWLQVSCSTSWARPARNGSGQSRTADTWSFNPLLYQLSYWTIMAVPTGIEPAISCVTGRRVNRYTTGPLVIAGGGFEPPTFGLWARRATELLHPAVMWNTEEEGFEPPRAVKPLSVFKTDPFSRTWVLLQIIWTLQDSNLRPNGYEPLALTNWAKGPKYNHNT